MRNSRSSIFSLSRAYLSFATLFTAAAAAAANQDLTRNGTIEQDIFHSLNFAEAQNRVATLKVEGYRPTSLSIYGNITDATYAGIWTKQISDAYETLLGANETAYNAWLEYWRSSGYVSTHVSATGSGSEALFAGIMQKTSSVGNWVQMCGLDSPYAYQNATIDTPMTIKGVSMYGDSNQRLYCILGHENSDNHQQTVWYQTNSFRNDYATLEADETSKRYWRPTFIDISEDQVLTPIFDDTSVGLWTTFTDLTASQLESVVAARKDKNMHLVHLSAAGDADAKYAGIFAEQITPLVREWHVTGNVSGFTNNDGVRDALDEVMGTFMKKNSVRQAQVAASVNGTVVASRAYTWAENDRAVVQPRDKFLLGSVSKAFTYAATNHLISTGLINLTTPVYPLLGYNKPADQRSQDITVQHLLDHTAGFDRTISPDIGFIFRDVAQSLDQASPATLRQLIEYIVARPLDFTPGDRSVYSNYGTMLMSYVITNLTGETFSSYIEKHVLNGADVQLWSTAADLHESDPIVQETRYTDISALTPLAKRKVSNAHGGDGSIKEEAIGAFGLQASAATISQFIGSHAAYGLGGREPWSWRDGTVVGARAIAYSLSELDWALTLNTREYSSEAAWEELVFTRIQGVWGRFMLKES